MKYFTLLLFSGLLLILSCNQNPYTAEYFKLTYIGVNKTTIVKSNHDSLVVKLKLYDSKGTANTITFQDSRTDSVGPEFWNALPPYPSQLNNSSDITSYVYLTIPDTLLKAFNSPKFKKTVFNISVTDSPIYSNIVVTDSILILP